MSEEEKIGTRNVQNTLGKATFGCYAHFPGTGPAGKTCSSCRHLAKGKFCMKWVSLMTRPTQRTNTVPKPTAISPMTQACKFYEPIPGF